MIRRILLFTLLLSMLAGCSPAGGTTQPPGSAANTTTNGKFTNISVEELHSMLEKKDFLFVNVHTPFQGNIPQTDLSIPYDQIDQHLSQLPDKNAKIVLYCSSGHMSTLAAQTLANLGYTHVYSLTGGFTAWGAAGYPIEKK